MNPAGTVFFARSGCGCGKNVVLRRAGARELGHATFVIDSRTGTTSTSLYAVDNGDTTTDVYYDPYKCGGQANIVKVTEP